MNRSQAKVLLLMVVYFAVPAILQGEGPTGHSQTTASETDLRSEIEQLKQLVQEQNKRIAALESGRGATAEASASPVNNAPAQGTETSTSHTSPQSLTAAQQAGSSDERIRNLEREIKGIGPISFSGDIRLRAEPSLGGPADQSLDRVRERVRARFNAVADLGQQFRAGITLASGDVNDPTTTNQTVTGFYTRKAVALDQAFVEYHPKQFKPLSLVAGKFRYPWFNTELTWDKDLNPEGVAETFALDVHTSVLKRFAVVAFQLPFAEVAGTTANNKRIAQQITYGGQLQTTWQLVPRLKLSAYSGFYWFQNADSITLALSRANTKNPQTPLVGLLPLGSGNGSQNSIYTTTAANVVTISGKAYPTGVTAVSNAQFASQFALFDSIARFDIDTGHARYPVMILGDYVQNTEACANAANIATAPANTATVNYTQTHNFACVANQRRGYWGEVRVGRLQQKGDWQVGYTRLFIEREAVLSNFNYSDIRQGSNVTEHRFDTFYQFDRNVQLGFTALVGRPLATTEPWLTRLQFDTVYIF